MALHREYEPATGPSSGPSPGCLALTAWYLATYEGSRPAPADLGIHVVKRLGTGWSLHAEGRASDLGTRPYSRPPWGRALAEELRTHSKELGVQCVIHQGRIWSGAFPDAGWRPYRGEPHGGHLHVELSRESARTLTVARIRAEIGGAGSEPAPVTDWTEELIMALPTIRKGDRGAHVARSMGLLAAAGYPPAKSRRKNGTYDGIAGSGWESACKRFQAGEGVRNSVRKDGTGDGIFGRQTWEHALTGRS